MIVAWFRSPPGEDSRTMSPGARWAWSSLSRNQLAAAGPIVPLTKSARRPARRHRDRPCRSPKMSCSARRTGPSSSPRPPAATGPGRRECRRRRPAGRRSRPTRNAACGAVLGGGGAGGWLAGMRGGTTAGPVGDLRKRFPTLAVFGRQSVLLARRARFGVGLARSNIRIYGRGYGGDATCQMDCGIATALVNGGGALGRGRLGAGLAGGRCGS